ncbi:MAG TPA: bacillithiol biosynthesis deacetylase BshB1 [Flavobacteriales bacterium]|nr:bacillithiol biosynthesis deacetylase BshB1 [Flavobacteriales bacterium]
MKVDVLAFGAHPDDIELSAAGTLAMLAAQNKKVAIVDLTRGELGTRGTAAIRDNESEASAKLLGIAKRVNLDLGDGFFEVEANALIKVIEQIRYFQPEIVFANAIDDRHPDHGRGSALVKRAAFLSGLVKIETSVDGKNQEAWRPRAVYHYIQDNFIEPDFVVDITGFEEIKMKAVACFSSQFFDPNSTEPETAISSPDFMSHIRSRMTQMGRYINVKSGEGFTIDRPLGIANPLLFI